MPDYRRYAIYYAPPAGSALADFGARWLGWDAERGATVAHIDAAGLPQPLEEITATPRKYGFHGTLKPPFRLADGKTAGQLRNAVAAFASARAPFDGPQLVVRNIGKFVAFVPSGDAPDLAAFASACVETFEPFRAPITEAELAKRNPAALSARQAEYVRRWGYPHVFEEFRFHLTLSGRLRDAAEIDAVAAAARKVAPPLDAPMTVTELCLFGERAVDGRFEIVERFALGG